MPNPVRVLLDRNRTMLLTPSIASSRGGLGQCERLGSHALLVTLTGTSWHWPSPSPQRMHTWKRPRRETVMTSGPQAQSSQPGSDSSPTPALASGTHAGNSWGGTRGSSTCTLGCCPHPLCQETKRGCFPESSPAESAGLLEAEGVEAPRPPEAVPRE